MELKDQDYLNMLYYLKLTREMENRLRALYRQGKIVGGVYLSTGQEAIAVGSSYAMEDGDVLCHSHRDMGALLVRGVEPKLVMAQYMAKATGRTGGRDGSLHFGDLGLGVIALISHLGDSLPVACGAALAIKMKGEERVVLVYFGEGASSRGDVHEAMNFAGLKKLPVIFICNNNLWAYSTPLKNEVAVKDIAIRAQGYGFPGVIVDGNDVLAVHSATSSAIERARGGQGPTLIECKSFRVCGHSEHDDASYVPKEVFEEWEAKDPIKTYLEYLKREGKITETDLSEIDERVKRGVEAAAKFAEESPYPDGADILKGVYAETSEDD